MKLSLSTISALTLTSLLMAAQPAAAQEQDTHQSDGVTNDTAASEGLWGTFKRNVTNVWQSDQYDLYVPFWTWHNRLTYDKEKLINTMKSRGVPGSASPTMMRIMTGTACTPWHLRIHTINGSRLSVTDSRRCGCRTGRMVSKPVSALPLA